MKTITTIILALAILTGSTGAQTRPEKSAKPLTTAGLIKSLASLAEKAEGQGMTDEAQAIYAAIAVAAKGTPARAVCGTDTECAEYDRNLKRLLKK
jgi:hypothetical protein